LPFFFQEKNKTLKKIDNLQNIFPKLHFSGMGGQVLKKRNLSLNAEGKFEEFSEKDIWENREFAGNLEMGSS